MPYASCHLQCSAAGSARTSRDRPSRLVIGATLARAERRTTLTRGGRVPFTNTVAPYPASCRSLPLSFFDRLSRLRACAVTLKFTLSRSSRGPDTTRRETLFIGLLRGPRRTAFSSRQRGSPVVPTRQQARRSIPPLGFFTKSTLRKDVLVSVCTRNWCATLLYIHLARHTHRASM